MDFGHLRELTIILMIGASCIVLIVLLGLMLFAK